MKQNSVNKISNIYCSCSKWKTSQQSRGSCQRLVFLLLEEIFPCLPLRRAEWGFLLNFPSPGRQMLSVKREYQCPIWKQRLHSGDPFPSIIQHSPDQQKTPHTRLRPSVVAHLHLKCFVPHVKCSLLVGVTGTRARWLLMKCCFWDKSKLQAARGLSWELIVISWTGFFFSQSLNRVQSRETPQNRPWRLRKSCCFNVEWNCIKWECEWSFA